MTAQSFWSKTPIKPIFPISSAEPTAEDLARVEAIRRRVKGAMSLEDIGYECAMYVEAARTGTPIDVLEILREEARAKWIGISDDEERNPYWTEGERIVGKAAKAKPASEWDRLMAE